MPELPEVETTVRAIKNFEGSVLKKLIIHGGFKRDILTFSDLSEVVEYSYSYLEKNKPETLLFSPSCSSFDQFRDYEERGDIFKKLIHEKFNLTLFKNKN